MTASNPYYNPDEDADILDDTPAKSSSRPKEYIIQGPNGKELPQELSEALSNYMDFDAISTRESAMPVELRAMAGMYEYFCDFTMFRAESPLLAALADVVDRQTNGLLREFYELHEAERKLVTLHMIETFQSMFLTAVTKAKFNDYDSEIQVYVSSFMDLIRFVYGQAIDRYRAQCAKLDHPVDEHLIENGILETRSWTQRVGMVAIPALEDVDEYKP